MDALLLSIDVRRYAVPLSQVAEVMSAVRIHALPDAPPIVEGVVNVRGAIVPVLALRHRLGHVLRDVRDSDYFVLARAGTRSVILRCDSAPVIVDITPPPEGVGDQFGPALAGVVPMADGVALFRDMDAFLAAEEHEALASLPIVNVQSP